MKLLVIGTAVPEEIEYAEALVSSAGNRFQLNLIRNLVAMDHEVESLTYVGMPLSAEALEKLQKKPSLAEASCRVKSHYVFKEGNPIRTYHAFQRMLLEALKQGDFDQILVYNTVHVWWNLPGMVKRFHGKSVLFLADFTPAREYHSPVRRLYADWMQHSMKHYDTVVALSPHVQKNLRLKGRVVLMMGAVDESLLDAFQEKRTQKTIPVRMMYSGLLSHVTGVDQLLEAFLQITSEDVLLIITGKGPLEDSVREAAKKDPRILFLGNLPYEEYLEVMEGCQLLINPRNMTLPENQNNFPSKVMDYLVAGKPILSTPFAGYENFVDYMQVCESSMQGLKNGLQKMLEGLLVASEEELEEVRQRNWQMANTFEWKKQLARILNTDKQSIASKL